MTRLTKLGALLALPLIVVLLLVPALMSQDQPSGRVSSLEVAVVSQTRVVTTITEDGLVYAVGEFGGKVFKTRVSEGVTDAYGISGGMLVYRVDEDLYQMDLRTGERKRLLNGWQVVRAAWKPRSSTLVAVVRSGESLALILAADANLDTAEMVRADSVRPEFLQWSDDGISLFFLTEDEESELKLVNSELGRPDQSTLIDKAAIPYLPAATDSALRSSQPTWELETVIREGQPIPVERNALGVLANSSDGLLLYPGWSDARAKSAIVTGGTVREATSTAQASSFGTYLGEFDTVAVYSNGSSGFVSNLANYIGSVYTGMKWQCVEFVRRYYLTKFTMDLASAWQASNRDANQWYTNAGQMNLDSFPNGGTTAPEVGDILVSEGGAAGHIAIVRSRSTNQVCTAQQNFSNDGTDVNRCLTLTASGSTYTVGGFSSNYPIRGWLHRRSAKAVMSTPTPGSTLTGSSATFTWTAGTNVSRYWMYAGNSVGAYDLYGADQGTNRSVTVSNLPTDGRTLYVRLWSYLSGGWQFADYTYRAATITTATKAVMSTPTPGSTLTGSSATFTWTAGTNVSRYWLYIGNSVGAYNLYGADQGTNRSVTVSNLPTDGRTLYVRLWSYLSGGWQFSDYQYRAVSR